MKNKLSLAQQLTIFITTPVIIISILMFIVFISYIIPNATKMILDIVSRGANSSSAVYASEWSYDILTSKAMREQDSDNKQLSNKIKTVFKDRPETLAVGIYSVKDSVHNLEEIKSFSKDMDKLAVKTSKSLPLESYINKIHDVTKPIQFFSGENIIVGTPVKIEDNIEGQYLVFVESISKYNSLIRSFSWGIGITLIVSILIIIFVIMVMGTRTAKPIKMLADTTSKIAAGDLTLHISQDGVSTAETALLSKSVGEMSKAISEQVGLIKNLTIQASSGSKEVSEAMTNLAGSSSEQATAVSETATTIEEMEKAGASVTSAVKRIVDAAERSSEASVRGRGAIKTASGIIERIKDDSSNIFQHSRLLLSSVEEIGNIINSVNAISEQSKILAVNASIEAAKAGEFGAGFAVVAQEVKDLAGQSKEATEQITQTLTSIRHSVENMVVMAKNGEERTDEGVSAISNTGAIINDLSYAIQEASEVANEIDSAVSQQSMGLSQIAAAMDEINTGSVENQKISTKMEDTTLELTSNLEELAVLVDIWTIDES
ncbi:MAG: hypothetical protein JXR91_04020 [Deltaproteobacteria bacterium]|nr:hypothetical protein [Deltaproteobacteria bacterium]